MGYDLARFESADILQNFMPELICSICQDVFRKLTRIKACEHVFCYVCLDTWLERSSHRCPICRVTVLKTRTALADDRMSSSMLDKLKLFCQFEKNGCQAVVELSQLEIHELACVYDPLKETDCDQGCGMKLRRSDLQQHSCIVTLMDHIEDLSKDNSSLRRDVGSLKNRTEELTKDNISLKQQSGSLKNRIEELIADNTSLKQCVSPLKRKIDELETQSGQLVKRMDKMAAHMSGCLADSLKFKSKAARFYTQVAESEARAKWKAESDYRSRQCFTVPGLGSIQETRRVEGPELSVYGMDCIPIFLFNAARGMVKMTFRWTPRDKGVTLKRLSLDGSIWVTIHPHTDLDEDSSSKSIVKNMFFGSTKGNEWPPRDLILFRNLCQRPCGEKVVRIEVAFPADISTLEFQPSSSYYGDDEHQLEETY